MNQLGDVSTALFQRRHFEQEIMILRVRWYLTYKLSYRDLKEMMAERGILLGAYHPHALGAALRPSLRGTVARLRPPGWRLLADR